MPIVGVLALQGDYQAHANALAKAGASAKEVRTIEELNGVDGLIIPGGESTTMLRLLHREDLFAPLRAFGETKPIFGTCAGAILLANEVTAPQQESLGLMDITVERNGYGRQLDSRVVHLEGDGVNDQFKGLEAVFIRAPIIRRVGPEGTVLARYNGDPIAVEQGKHLVATFHPELTKDGRFHAYFLAKLAK
jgi:5'-phosphate synthase pdxT subunit